MKVVVDELPIGCKECVFTGEDELFGYCILSKWKIYNEEEAEIIPYREEHCPLVEFGELIKELRC